MKKLITVLYSVAAGLEQAYLTYETFKQASKAAAVMAVRNTPETKAPMGFTCDRQINPVPAFTAEEP